MKYVLLLYRIEIKPNNFSISGDPTSPVSNSYRCPRSPSFNVDGSEEYHLSLFTLISIPGASTLARLKEGDRGRRHGITKFAKYKDLHLYIPKNYSV